MIVFSKLRWKNLLSTGNIFTEIELNKHKTTLIVGNNGAGKSTILEALSFALFGKPFRKINKPQLLNTITQKNLVVEIEFSVGTKEYKIIRGIKPNIFEIYLNNVLLNQSAEMKDYQEILEKQILKVNHKSFCQVVIIGAATFQPFMQLTAAQRREIIEDLLDLQIFTTMNSILKDKVSINSNSINEVLTNIKVLESKIKISKEHIEKLQTNNDQLVEEKRQKINSTKNQILTINKEYSIISDNIKELEATKEDDTSLNGKLNKLSSLRHKIEAKIEVISKEIKFFNKNDECPTCKQSIDEKFKCESIKTREEELALIDEGLQKLSYQYEELEQKIKSIMKLDETINSLKMNLRLHTSRINSLTEYIDNLEEEIKSINKKIKIVKNGDISIFEKELKKLNNDYNSLLEEKSLLSVTGTLLKDGGIKSKIIKQYIPIINKLINKFLSSMEFMCHFELNENFEETIKSRYRDEFSYSSFSEGEKMRINLAILFTWRAIAKMRNSINANILIMDEVFDSSLDGFGAEDFLKIINQLTEGSSTFIISHRSDHFFDKFEKVIKFDKKKNFSKII